MQDADMISQVSSYEAIKKFKRQFQLGDGDIFLGILDVESVNGKYILADTCECIFSYNVPYQQYEIVIMWNYEDPQLSKKGIQKGYNTNYCSFSLDDDYLVITDKTNVITIRFAERGQT